MTEARYQAGLIERLEQRFPGCFILKNDPQYKQGVPDLTLLWGPQWALLEVKARATAADRPNQTYYVEELNNMGFAAKIYPENEEEVLAALEQAFASRGPACLPQS